MFVAPSGPFQGLAATDLAVRPGHRRLLAALRSVPVGAAPKLNNHPGQKRRAGTKRKEVIMSHAEKVDRLRQSVAEILEKSDGTERETLLRKSFDEFAEDLEKDATAEEIEASTSLEAFARALGEADQFAARLIEQDEVDETTAELLARWSALGNFALTAAVNAEMEPVSDEELAEVDVEAAKADGYSFYDMELAPLQKADGSEEPGETLTLRSRLPEDLAKFAADPDLVTGGVAALGAELMELAGVDLTKFAQPENGAGPPAAPPQAGGNDLADQVQIMMRLMAAGLVQGEALLNALGGEAQPMDGTGGETPEEAAVSGEEEDAPEEEMMHEEEQGDEEPEEPEEPKAEAKSEAKPEEKKKNPFAKADDAAELKKMFSDAITEATGPLQKALDDARKEIERLKSQPSAPKGAAMALSKTDDRAAQADALSKIAELPEKDRTMALMKLAQAIPIPVGR